MPAGSLQPAGDARRAAWLRRATLALTGMPVREDDAASFLADPSADAAEKVITRLQASPAYGERMAQWWMELVGYADQHPAAVSAGLRPVEAWRYRDWLIATFNATPDLRTLSEWHLTGDLRARTAAGPDRSALLATTWLAFGRWPASEPEKLIDTWASDRSERAGDLFAGLSVSCARCHDHPQLPLTREDAAAWAGLWRGDRFLVRDAADRPGLPRVATASDAAMKKRADELAQLAAGREEMSRLQGEFARESARHFLPQTAEYVQAAAAWHAAGRPDAVAYAEKRGLHGTAFAGWLTYLGLDGTAPASVRSAAWYPAWEKALESGKADAVREAAALVQKGHVLDDESPFVALLIAEPEGLTLDQLTQLKRLSSKLQSLQRKLTSDDPVHAIQPADPPAAPPVFSDACLELTGLPVKLDAAVPWRTPRQAVAQWLLQREPQVLARALAHAVWTGLDGPPLLDSPAAAWAGTPPKHARVLDALAATLVAEKWALPALQRAILLSPAWLGPEDPAWPRPAKRTLTRIEARDAALHRAGKLDARLFGLPEAPEGSVRRSIYLRWSEGRPLMGKEDILSGDDALLLPPE